MGRVYIAMPLFVLQENESVAIFSIFKLILFYRNAFYYIKLFKLLLKIFFLRNGTKPKAFSFAVINKKREKPVRSQIREAAIRKCLTFLHDP